MASASIGISPGGLLSRQEADTEQNVSNLLIPSSAIGSGTRAEAYSRFLPFFPVFSRRAFKTTLSASR